MSVGTPWCSCCGNEGRITICVCLQCMEALLARYRCARPGCHNVARYDSGLCGVCDVLHNQGLGKRISDLVRADRPVARAPTELDPEQ